jgi:hypothetical protein
MPRAASYEVGEKENPGSGCVPAGNGLQPVQEGDRPFLLEHES